MSVPRDLLGPVRVGAALLTPVALGLSVAGWRRGIERGYAIAGTFISGAGLVVAVVWLVVRVAA